MKVLIHDLNEQNISSLGKIENDFIVFNANGVFAYCTGCYKCWLKTPGACAINDGLKDIGALLGNSEETIIISQNTYGGYSEQVKRVFDRSISGSLPFFTFRSRKLRHTRRHKINRKRLVIIFYGNFLDTEIKTAELLAEANRSNMAFKEIKLHIAEQTNEIERILYEYTHY
jgi:multimeric flavodoxin WrbA